MSEVDALSATATVPVERPAAVQAGFPRRVWERWRKAAHALGVVQTRFLMLLIYATVVVPTGVLMKMFRDPLHLRPPQAGNWTPTRQEEQSLETARRQF